MKDYYKYAEEVAGGQRVACLYVRQAVERFLGMLCRDDIEFREERVDRALSFIAMLRHFKNRHAGKPFVLQPWQQFIVAAIYGFYWVGSGRRVVQNVYIEIARKNGKTALCGALGLLHLVADGVAGAEVDFVANSKDQAKIAFEFARKFAEGLNGKRKYLRTYRDRIFFDTTDSKLHVFASDASKLDGFGASAYIIDEYHEAKDTALRDVLRSSQADRDDPMGIIITTAGFDKGGPCYLLRSRCVDILGGVEVGVAADSTFCVIFTQDEADDLGDERLWIKSNPNLGVTVHPSFLAREVENAKADPSSEVGILTKNFNLWTDTAQTWIPDPYIVAATHTHRLLDFYNAPEQWDVFVGIDLSATSDLTAVAYLVPRPDALYYWIDYYLPEEALKTKPLKEQYKEWKRGGYLKTTPGNVVDYDYILADILRLEEAGLYIMKVGYDSWNATQFVIRATEEGLPMEAYAQNIGSFNRPTKELERLMLSGGVRFANNPITRFGFRNVEIKTDHNGNIKPSKGNAERKIDGIIAALEALGVYLSNE